MIDWVAKVQARGGDMDAPKRIWAWTFKDCDWKSAWTVADEDAPPHATAYIRADLAAADLAELVETLRNIAAQKKTTELETEYDVECADFEGGYDAIIDVARAALAKIKEATP